MKVPKVFVKLGAFVLVGSLLAFTPAGAASRSSQAAGSSVRSRLVTGGLHFRGTTNVSKIPVLKGTAAWARDPYTRDLGDGEQSSGGAGGGGLPTPTPPAQPITTDHPGAQGWSGLSHYDQRLANGGNQFSLEPPDQALCVGGQFVMEAVNNGFSIYDRESHIVVPPIGMTQFYNLPPEINRSTGEYGPFISDPKCYYDQATQHWFVTELIIDQDKQGNFTGTSGTLLAVSHGPNPTGAYYQYRFDATNANHPNCPCFGDQPLIGADANGFYISTAEYDLEPFGAHFNGPQLYALSKAALENGTASSYVLFDSVYGATAPTGTLQPATSPGGQFDTTNGGTEYLVSGRDTLTDGTGNLNPDNQDTADVWTLSNTSSLDSASPALSLQKQTVLTEVYGQPVPAIQASGPRPLGGLVNEPKPKLNTNDDRMNQVVYAGSLLWTGVNTILGPTSHTGIAWFAISPGADNSGAAVVRQAYINGGGRNAVMFPSIGVNTNGQAVAAFSLSGPGMYPSAGYQTLGPVSENLIHISRGGFRPDDGFTGYPAIGGGNGVGRWGDYSAAVADENGTIWMANEYIPDGPRTFYANWGTFINRVAAQNNT